MMDNKTDIRGSSLAEALVAGIIFMTMFIIAMDTATAILSIPDGRERLETEQAFNECLKTFMGEDETAVPYNRKYKFEWGTVTVSAEPYSDGIISVTEEAVTNSGQKTIYKRLCSIDDKYENGIQ